MWGWTARVCLHVDFGQLTHTGQGSAGGQEAAYAEGVICGFLTL